MQNLKAYLLPLFSQTEFCITFTTCVKVCCSVACCVFWNTEFESRRPYALNNGCTTHYKAAWKNRTMFVQLTVHAETLLYLNIPTNNCFFIILSSILPFFFLSVYSSNTKSISPPSSSTSSSSLSFPLFSSSHQHHHAQFSFSVQVLRYKWLTTALAHRITKDCKLPSHRLHPHAVFVFVWQHG